MAVAADFDARFCLRAKPMTEENSSSPESEASGSVAIGIALGISLGVSFGVALDNLALGISLGLAIGAALGASGAFGGNTSKSCEIESKDQEK
ncbi:MAG: hypothetical protein AAGG44_03190 [Planctomycetota bacterium]